MATCRALFLTALCLSAAPALSQDAAIGPGKQRAAASKLQWEVREAGHPVLGNIRFAFLVTPVTTAVDKSTIWSNVYVSCEKNRRRIAVELTNTRALDDSGGMKPASLPRLVCHRAEGNHIVDEELDAHWTTNALGDVMARGLAPFPLRECVAIDIHEEVTLPKEWGHKSASIAFEIAPYARELDDVFATCGERAVYVHAPSAPAAVAKNHAGASPAKSAATPPAGWKPARTTARGITWVRSKPSPKAPITAKVYPGDLVVVQEAGESWWHIRPHRGHAYDGYVRRDRVVFQ